MAAQRVRAPLALLGSTALISVVAAIRPGETVDSIGAMTFFLVLAVYSGAAHTSGRITLVAGCFVGLIALADQASDPAGVNVEGLVFYGLFFGLPWALGRVMRQRRLK